MADTDFTDSYVLTDAILEAFLADDPRAEAIALKAAAASAQQWYCRRATKAIDALPFSGYKLAEDQDRAFPRKYENYGQVSPYSEEINTDSFGYVYESTDVPDDIITACCEEALALYALYSSPDRLMRLKLQRDGVTSVNYSGTSEQFVSNPSGNISSAGTRYMGLMSKEAFDLISKYIGNNAVII
jgi:hypothetical protein